MLYEYIMQQIKRQKLFFKNILINYIYRRIIRNYKVLLFISQNEYLYDTNNNKENIFELNPFELKTKGKLILDDSVI